MSNRSYASFLLFSLVMGAPLGVAHAQSAAMEADADSDPLMQRGIELRRAGRDSEALEVFQSALERTPTSTRVRVHLAATHQALGQWLEAEQNLSLVLSEADDPYIRRHRATLEKAYDFVGRRLGSLDVVGEPAGAEVVLSGRRLGELPLSEPARVPVGSYVLEVRKAGYFAVTRPISIASRSLLRESVELGAEDAPVPDWIVSREPGAPGLDTSAGSPRWLTWTLAGLGAGAALTAGVTFAIREQHASRWNSADCLLPGRTRGQVCSSELDAGRAAERTAVMTSVAAGLLFGGAITSYLLEQEPGDHGVGQAAGCGLGFASASCFGSF